MTISQKQATNQMAQIPGINAHKTPQEVNFANTLVSGGVSRTANF